MDTINCFIVENDPVSLMWLNSVIQEIEFVNIVGFASAKEEAISKIDNLRIDLLVSDIELDEYNAFDILENLSVQPDFGIIFITSHEQYAIKAIKVNALDYLTKPISKDELILAINRFKANKNENLRKVKQLLDILNSTESKKRISLPLKEHTELVSADDIIYFKADVNYCNVYLTNLKPILVSKTLKEFDSYFMSNQEFFRIHQSYLININHISKIIKTKLPQVIMSNGDTLTVSRSKKVEFLDKIL